MHDISYFQWTICIWISFHGKVGVKNLTNPYNFCISDCLQISTLQRVYKENSSNQKLKILCQSLNKTKHKQNESLHTVIFNHVVVFCWTGQKKIFFLPNFLFQFIFILYSLGQFSLLQIQIVMQKWHINSKLVLQVWSFQQ